MAQPRILLFDLYAGGHHGQYIRQLVDYWSRHALPGRLDIVVSPTFLDKHPEVSDAVTAAMNVHLTCITEPFTIYPSSKRFYTLRNNREHGRMLRTYIARLRPDVAVCMYFDHLQLPLAFDLRFPFPIRISGIYFRPSFHYNDFDEAATRWKDRVYGWQKRLLLKMALRNPHVSHLFCLDHYVLPYVEAMNSRVRAVTLPDGVTLHPAQQSREAVRARWDMDETRKVALLFGVIDERKGVHQVLDALLHLPHEMHHHLGLVLAGPIRASDRDRVLAGVEQVRAQTTIQIVVNDRFIPDEEIQPLVRAADLALVTYQRHVGSSNVLVRAAAEAVPVLGSDYGVVGQHLRRRRLGLPVDTTDSLAIARGLEQWLADPTAFPFDADEARRFAEENTAERFAATIFEHSLSKIAGR